MIICQYSIIFLLPVLSLRRNNKV